MVILGMVDPIALPTSIDYFPSKPPFLSEIFQPRWSAPGSTRECFDVWCTRSGEVKAAFRFYVFEKTHEN